MSFNKVLEELLKAGLTQERAQECWRHLQNEIGLHAAVMEQQLSAVEQNNPQTKKEERQEEKQQKSQDQLAQRIVSLALRVKSDPNDLGLQKMLTQMPIVARTVGLVSQALEQQPAATSQQSNNWPPNPLNTRSFTPFKT